MSEPLVTKEQIEACYDPTMAPNTMAFDTPNGRVVIHLSEWPDSQIGNG